MHIRFGHNLDGLDPAPPRTCVGEATLGVMGLLSMLESDLGLAPVLEPPTEQIVAYRGCLSELDNEARFYHRSFEVDPVGVARTLHYWRTQWYEAGWDGRFPDTAPSRLADMADIEQLAADRVPLCLGQRLQRILDALTTRRTQIEVLTLLTQFDALPILWQQVLEKIGYEIDPGIQPTINALTGTDLATVQSLLIGLRDGERAEGKVHLNQDGSFVVVHASSRDISARAIAETVRAGESFSDTVVIAEHDGIVVDNAMERSGLPRCGYQHYSRFRAVSQVLKLSLALLWEPANPHTLLQFFVHPLGPVPLRIRRALAEAVSAEPGIGGRAWTRAIKELEEALGQAEDHEAKIKAFRNTIQEWFESERFDPSNGAPIDALNTRITRVQTWLSARLSQLEDTGERVMFGGALAQADTLSAAIKNLADQGRTHIERLELERLVDEVSQAQPNPDLFAEAGHVRACTHPANVVQPWNQVIWWDLAPQKHQDAYPWSSTELDTLAGAGVALPSLEDKLRHRSETWLQPIVKAQSRCILVVHHSDEGYHPLWTQLSSLFENWSEVVLEDTLLEGEVAQIPFLDVESEPLTVRTLPTAKRWWELPEGTDIPTRAQESYSSLNKLFNHPHEWVLNYQAKLRLGRAQDIADGALLYGTLAHRLFESFFNTHEDWREMNTAALQAWLDQAIPELIRREGAVLLEPGRGVDHEQVVTTLERAFHRLLEHLVAGDIVNVRAEQHEEAPYFADGIQLRGEIDLLLTRADGQEIVVDAKWGGETYRGEELENNQHLQLASYAYLRKRATSANDWPYQAYFIVTTANMLAPDNKVFPEARVWAPPNGVDVAGLWSRGEQTYTWRREQLDNGHIEVNCDGAKPTNRSEAPEGALNTAVKASPWDDYVHLTGWDEFA